MYRHLKLSTDGRLARVTLEPPASGATRFPPS